MGEEVLGGEEEQEGQKDGRNKYLFSLLGSAMYFHTLYFVALFLYFLDLVQLII